MITFERHDRRVRTAGSLAEAEQSGKVASDRPSAFARSGADANGPDDRGRWDVRPMPGSLRLDAGELDDLGPLFSFTCHEFAEA